MAEVRHAYDVNLVPDEICPLVPLPAWCAGPCLGGPPPPGGPSLHRAILSGGPPLWCWCL